MKELIILMVVLLLAFSSQSAFTEPWGRRMRPGDEGSIHPESKLHLTQEQTEQLQRMRASYIKEITHLYNRLFSRQAEIRLLWTEPDPDPEKIMEKQKEILRIQGQLSEKAIQHQFDCRSILTEEQKAKLKSGSAGMGRGNGPGWQRR